MQPTEAVRAAVEGSMPIMGAEHKQYRTPTNPVVRAQLDLLFAQLQDAPESRPGRMVSSTKKKVIAEIVGLLEEHGHNLLELKRNFRMSYDIINSSVKEAGSQLSEAETAALEILKSRVIVHTAVEKRQYSDTNRREIVATLRLLRKQRADLTTFRKQHRLSHTVTTPWEKMYANETTQWLVPDVFPQDEPVVCTILTPSSVSGDIVPAPVEVTGAVQPKQIEIQESAVSTAEVIIQTNFTIAHGLECPSAPIHPHDAIIDTMHQQIAALTGMVSEVMRQHEMIMQVLEKKARPKRPQSAPLPSRNGKVHE